MVGSPPYLEDYRHAVRSPIADPNTDAGQEHWPGGLCEAVGTEDTEALRLITSALWAAFRWTPLRLVQRQGTGITLHEHVQELFTVLLLSLAYATEPSAISGSACSASCIGCGSAS
jgi:hypothetical protein